MTHLNWPATGFAITVLAILTATNAVAEGERPSTRFDSATDWAKFPKLFSTYGRSPDRTATVGPDGLTLSVPLRKEPGHVGMQAPVRLAGDFQVSVAYELLAPLPATISEGYGVSLGVSVGFDANSGGASATRGVWRAA